MDLILFPTYAVPSTLYAHVAERSPDLAVDAFATWPDHMRREFALLAAEAGYSDADVRERTGIAPVALGRARFTTGRHALVWSEAAGPSSDADLAHRVVQRRYHDRKRDAERQQRVRDRRRDGDA